MLANTSYPKEYVETVRARFGAATGDYGLLVVALDRAFVHRVRKNEGKDGNALNEVRMITDSILENGGVLAANSTIKYTPETAVLGLAVGDEIVVEADGFTRLLDAFLSEIESRYP